MKCKHCGKTLNKVEIDMFNVDGTNSWEETGIDDEIDGNGFSLITSENWTGWDLSDEEREETIRCPFCRKPPLKHMAIDASGTFIPVLCYDPDEHAADSERSLADKMFADLGYSGTASGCYDSVTGTRSISFFCEEANDPDSFVEIELSGKYEVCVTFDEIRAIAQKIKEMEV